MLEGLDFTWCSTVDACLRRVEVILVQANAVHNHTCSTRKRAMALLRPKKPSRYILSNDDKALIIANAVFPDHCNDFFALKMAMNPNTLPYLDQDTKKSLAAALRTKNHLPLIHLLEL